MSNRTDTVLNETATALDKILNALLPPGPPPYDPLLDPEKTVFQMRDGTKKVLTNIEGNNNWSWDSEDEDYLLLYFDGSETPADNSMYADVIGLKLGTEFESWQYNSSGTTIMAPKEGAGDYGPAEYPNLQWIKFEHIGNISDYAGANSQLIFMNGLPNLTSIIFPLSADGSIYIGNDTNLKILNHPLGQIFKESYQTFYNSNLSVINFPSSGYVKTCNFSYGDEEGFPSSVESVTIPENLSFDFGNYTFANQKDVYFEGRSVDTVKGLPGYGIGGMFGDVSETPSQYGDPNPIMTLHCSDGDISLYEYIP